MSNKDISQHSDVDHQVVKKQLYFVNEIVEWNLTKYIWTGCTKVKLRDEIMSNATELIRQMIRKQKLHVIYPGQEESAFGDLLQTAWCQIERTLYKYRSKPHCRLCYNPDRPSDSLLYHPANDEYGIKTFDEVIRLHKKKCPKCGGTLKAEPIVEPQQGRFGGSESILYRGSSKVFNMWSQISRTVILAYIKKESRDHRNSTAYKTHLDTKSTPNGEVISRFISEARELCKYNDNYLKIIEELEFLVEHDPRPYDGIISKLVNRTGFSRVTVTSFIRTIKLRSFEFTDSPISRNSESASRDKVGREGDEDES